MGTSERFWNFRDYRGRDAARAVRSGRMTAADGGESVVRDFLKEKEALENPVTLKEICRFGLKVLAVIMLFILGVQSFLK